MVRPLVVRVLCYSGAFLFVAAAVYCFLWFLSSSSLACMACNCTYTMFAENARCRQPPVAALLGAGSIFIAIGLIIIGRRNRS